jgi:hypothetical protein
MDDFPQPPDDFAHAFESAFARLQVAVLEACARARPWPAQVAAAIETALAFAAADPAAARVLLVRAPVERPDGPGRHLRLVECFAELLAAEAPRDRRRPASAAEAVVGGIAVIVADHIRADDPQALPALLPELVELALVPYLGRAEARRWAGG